MTKVKDVRLVGVCAFRNVAGKRKGHSQAVPAKRMAMTQEVPVTCGCSSGVYDIRRGCISLRAAQHGQVTLPSRFPWPAAVWAHIQGKRMTCQHCQYRTVRLGGRLAAELLLQKGVHLGRLVFGLFGCAGYV